MLKLKEMLLMHSISVFKAPRTRTCPKNFSLPCRLYLEPSTALLQHNSLMCPRSVVFVSRDIAKHFLELQPQCRCHMKQYLCAGLDPWAVRIELTDVSVWASFQRICLVIAAAVSWQQQLTRLNQVAVKLGLKPEYTAQVMLKYPHGQMVLSHICLVV